MDIQAYITVISNFLANSVMPFLMLLAFLFFVWNAFRYFIIESDSEDGRTKARAFAMYGLLAFVLLTTFWGLINLLMSALGAKNGSALSPDYFKSPPSQSGQPTNSEDSWWNSGNGGDPYADSIESGNQGGWGAQTDPADGANYYVSPPDNDDGTSPRSWGDPKNDF